MGDMVLLDAKGVLTEGGPGGVYVVPESEFTHAHAVLLWDLERALHGSGVATRSHTARRKLLVQMVAVSMANCRTDRTDMRQNAKYRAALEECARRGVALTRSTHLSDNPYQRGLPIVRAFWISR